MKHILIILFGLFMFVGAKAQFPGTDSLRTYNVKYITNNAATAFTNLRLHTLLRGIIDWIDTARAGTGGGGVLGVDTLFALNDSTIRWRRNGLWRNTVLKGVYDTRRKVDTAYALNDSTLQIKINGTNRNIILPGRHWNLQGVLNNGSTLTENEVITLADSLTFTSGLVIISSLNLPSLTTSTDTTANKPVAINASGNVVKMGSWPGDGNSVNNMYNIDSTISANRTITQAGRYLRFQQSGINYTQYNGALQTIQADSTSVPFYTKIIKSPYAGTPAEGMLEWREGLGFADQSPSRPNYPYMRGWNLAAGGSAFVSGLPAMGESWEPHYLTDVNSPTLWLMEYHKYFIQKSGLQRRLESWTINTRDNLWNVYYTTPAWSLRDTFSVDYLSASTASATDRTTVVEHQSGNSTTRTQFISNGTEDLFQIKSISLGQLEFEGFTNIDFGAGDGFDVTNDTWGMTNLSQGINVIRATNPFGFHFKNLIGGGDIGAITYDNTTGENRFFNAAGGYFATFYANGNKLMELSTTGNVLVTNDLTVADEAYNATTWESSLEVPTKNAVRDKIESLTTGVSSINSQTGAITITGGTGISVGTGGGTITVSRDDGTTVRSLAIFFTPATNTGTSETDLYTYTLPANTLNANGKSITWDVSGLFSDATSTPRVRLYFAGTLIFDSGVLTLSSTGKWNAKLNVMRSTSTAAVVSVTFTANNTTITAPVEVTDLSSQDFTITNILKVTGTATGAGGGDNDISAKQGLIMFIPAP